MRKLMLVVILPLLFGLAFAGPNLSTVSDPNAVRKPADPNAPAIVEVPVPPTPITDAPPPFGTILQSWAVTMSGQYGGSGITNWREKGRLYCVDQAAMGGTPDVYSYVATDPVGTWRQEHWTFPSFGGSLPWGIAFDPDSNCFWVSHTTGGGGGTSSLLARFDTLGQWMGRPQDTWQTCPLMTTNWIGGFDKWPGTDTFFGLPVQMLPTIVVKFNPYTKTFYGPVTYGGTTAEERGSTFLPYDSLYILTTGWYNNSYRKRDTTGFLLQDVYAGTGCADVTFWVPESPGPDDTCIFFCMNSSPDNLLQKVSAGMLWSQLPSVSDFNVRPTAILSPTGTIDSGQSIIPRLIIRNMSSTPATDVKAFFTIDDGTPTGYNDSLTGIYLDMHTAETLAFGGWVPRGRDSMGVVAWTYWAGDSIPKDDTIRNRILVRVKDVGITEIKVPAPDTTVDSGVVFSPQCRVWNYGNVSLNFDVRFRIGAWQATRNLNLIAGGATLVTAPTPYTAMPGIWACICNAVVVGDLHPENNVMIDTFTVRGTVTVDVAARAVLAPTGVVDTTQVITPSGRFANLGIDPAAFWGFFSIRNSGGTEIYAESSQVMLNPGDSTDVEFATIQFSILGNYTAICSTAMPGDQNSTNDVVKAPFRVVDKVTGDIGVTAILQPPAHVYPDSSFIPTATWKNYGEDEATITAYFFIHNKYGVRMYNQLQAGVTLSGGAETTLTFASFNVGNDTGHWYARCSTMAGDTNFSNDTLDKPFVVSANTWPPGWAEVAALPMTPSGKAVKDGGWLAYDASKGWIFGAKGNKTSDFYAFDPNADGWNTMTAVPPGTEAKPVGKGAAGCADGNGKVYAVKGNNTLGFYEYNAADNTWSQKKDVPTGAGKKIKGGAGLAWGTKAGVGAVYVLKGYKNEFYKYSPLDSTWTTLTPAPVGSKEKWDKGSWLVSDGGHMLYAHKAKYHEFYTYDCEMDSWSSAKTAMPIPGSAGSKKSKDGGSAAWLDGKIYAFKGGNTVEFWKYSPDGDSWGEKEQIPLIGSTGKKKKVKAGAALAGIPGMAVFGFKGNKSFEFWRYVPATMVAAPANREGVMSGVLPGLTGALRISPNPLAGGFATLRYSLPKAGLASLHIYDVTGRTVLSQTLLAGRTGTAGIDLRKLEAGVYLVKVTTEGFSTTQKLVVQH